MRGLNRFRIAGPWDERGVIAPLTALMMVAMLGMGALAVDTAMMYSEKAQLQNGADASALAIARSCAGGIDLDACQNDLANANALAGGNALDGVTEVVKAKVDEATGTVYVEVQSSDTEGKKYFSLVFARALGIDTVDIRASAETKFEGYRRAIVLPMTFSTCEAEDGWTKPLQFLPLHGSTLATLCKSKYSGLEVSGGFGWLADTVADGGCQLSVDLLATRSYQSDTGINVPADCNDRFMQFENDLKAGKSVEVLIPIFYAVTGKGKDAVFHVEAFAHISLQGWQFGASGRQYLTSDAQALSTKMKLKPTDSGIFGKFVKKVSWAEAADLGGLDGLETYQAGGIRLSK